MPTLGDQLTLTFATAGAVVLNKVGPIGDESRPGSKYFLKTSTQEFTAKVRHSTLKDGFDRHNCEVSIRTYATETVPEKRPEKFWIVWEKDPMATDTQLPDAVCDACVANSNELLTEFTQYIS